jgi:hypothetical protein
VAKHPTQVFLVSVNGEWPVSCIVDYGKADLARRVYNEVKHRATIAGCAVSAVKVHRARLIEITEMEVLPPKEVAAEIVQKEVLTQI